LSFVFGAAGQQLVSAAAYLVLNLRSFAAAKPISSWYIEAVKHRQSPVPIFCRSLFIRLVTIASYFTIQGKTAVIYYRQMN
jgi:hypothetical protein